MMSRPSALSCLAFSATTMIALGLARPMRLASWGIAGTSGVWGAEAAGGRIAVNRRALCSPLILARHLPAPDPAERTAAAVRGSGGEDLVPLRDAVGLRRQRAIGVTLDLHRLDGVALL